MFPLDGVGKKWLASGGLASVVYLEPHFDELKAMGYRDQVDSGTAKPSVREMVDQILASWNRVTVWLQHVERLRTLRTEPKHCDICSRPMA